MKMKEEIRENMIILPAALLNDVVLYLLKRPAGEVMHLITNIKALSKDVEVKTLEPSSDED